MGIFWISCIYSCVGEFFLSEKSKTFRSKNKEVGEKKKGVVTRLFRIENIDEVEVLG